MRMVKMIQFLEEGQELLKVFLLPNYLRWSHGLTRELYNTYIHLQKVIIIVIHPLIIVYNYSSAPSV